MKKIWIGLVAVALIAVLGWYFFANKGKESGKQETVKIGADLTLTGGIAYWGQQIKKGMDIAEDEANAKETSTIKVKILYQDNKGQATDAIAIFRKFAVVDKVTAVVSVFSPVSNPLRDIARQQNIPLLATVVSAEGFGLDNEWCFRDFPSQLQQSTVLAKYVYTALGLKSAVTLVVTDEYGKDGETVFVREFEKLGGKVLAKDYIDQSAKSVREQAVKLIDLKPECLYVVVRDLTLGTVIKQFRELGYNGKIVGVNAFDSPSVWEAAGAYGDGCIFTSAYINLNNAQTKQFIDSYKNKNHGDEPDWIAVYGYTMGQYLLDCAQRSKGDPKVLREYLSNLRFNSIRGNLIMDSNRDVISPIGIFERNGNKNDVVEIH